MFIIKQKTTSGRINVHLAESVHRPGQTPMHTRQHLGVLDSRTGELLLSRKKPTLSAEVLALLSAKGIGFSGKAAPGCGRQPKPLEIAKLGRAQVEEIGRVGVLTHLAETSGLLRCLQHAFGADDARRLLCAAMHEVCEKNPLYMIEEWLEGVADATSEGLSPASMCELARLLGAKSAVSLRQLFFTEWIKACGMPRALIHDTTSLSTWSKRLEDAEWGYNRDEENLPQVNLALVVAKDSRIPVWYRMLSGSVPDVASLQGTAIQLKALGLEEFSFSLDRGYFSVANLVAMANAKISFTVGVPLHTKQARALVKRYRASLGAFKRQFLDASGEPISHVQTEITLTAKGGKSLILPAHLYFSQGRQAQTAGRLAKTVLELESKAKLNTFEHQREAWGWLKENAGDLAKYLSVTNKSGVVSIRAKSNRVAAANRSFGMTLIATNGALASTDREDVLADYRSRDIGEKVFDAYKNATGNDRLRTGNDDAAEGRLFIAFIAVTLRALFEEAMRRAGMKKQVTVPEALARLKKIRRLWLSETQCTLLETPKKSREVAVAAGIAPEDMVRAARHLTAESPATPPPPSR